MAKRPTGRRDPLVRRRRRRRFFVDDVPPLRASRRLAAVAAGALRIAERQAHLESEIGAQEVRHVGAVGLDDESLLVLAETEIVEEDVARAVAQHLMHRLPRRRLVERRVEQLLDPRRIQVLGVAIPRRMHGPDAFPRARPRRRFALHHDVAHDRAASGSCALAGELGLPRAGGRRGDLGEPKIGRAPMPVVRLGRDGALRRNQLQARPRAAPRQRR